jgi:hypothetical protein
VPSGWTRYVLEKFEFPHTVVTSDVLDQANLRQKFDVLILVDDTTTTSFTPLKKFMDDGVPSSRLAMRRKSLTS